MEMQLVPLACSSPASRPALPYLQVYATVSISCFSKSKSSTWLSSWDAYFLQSLALTSPRFEKLSHIQWDGGAFQSLEAEKRLFSKGCWRMNPGPAILVLKTRAADLWSVLQAPAQALPFIFFWTLSSCSPRRLHQVKNVGCCSGQ